MMLAAALVLAALFQAGPTHGSAPTSLVAAAGPRVVQRVAGADPRVRPVVDLEEAVQRDPENLKLAAEYRQLVIASGNFDRSIDVLQKLAKRQGSGPNVHISLALAYVDKVPPSGDIRRLYLGRDAIGAATKAIERQPSVIAFYIRGLVNLYYNNFIFKRIPRGIADLEHALTLVATDTPRPLVARIYASIGDGYWRLDNRAKAREVWARGAEQCPGDAGLKARLSPDERVVADTVSAALYAGTRVDTTLRDIVR
jgi:tetratricopeptide (TPR) repeat protein